MCVCIFVSFGPRANVVSLYFMKPTIHPGAVAAAAPQPLMSCVRLRWHVGITSASNSAKKTDQSTNLQSSSPLLRRRGGCCWCCLHSCLEGRRWPGRAAVILVEGCRRRCRRRGMLLLLLLLLLLGLLLLVILLRLLHGVLHRRRRAHGARRPRHTCQRGGRGHVRAGGPLLHLVLLVLLHLVLLVLLLLLHLVLLLLLLLLLLGHEMLEVDGLVREHPPWRRSGGHRGGAGACPKAEAPFAAAAASAIMAEW